MAKHILFCERCKEYTLHENCPRCGEKTFQNIPPKFSVDDKYEDLRRKAKEEMYREKGFL